MNKKPHKHAELIKAWADGAEIQIKLSDGIWKDIEYPNWGTYVEYRVKPEEDPYRELKEAYKAGKTIQILHVNSWLNLKGEPGWSNPVDRYRVKPEPKYVPFTWEDRDLIRGKWLKTKDGKKEFLVDALYNFGNMPSTVSGMNFEKLLEECVFLDGSPCGKLVEH